MSKQQEDEIRFRRAWFVATQTYLIFSRPRRLTTFQAYLDVLTVLFPIATVYLTTKIGEWGPVPQTVIDGLSLILAGSGFVSLVLGLPAKSARSEEYALTYAKVLSQLDRLQPPGLKGYGPKRRNLLSVIESQVSDSVLHDVEAGVTKHEKWVANQEAKARFFSRFSCQPPK